MNKKLLGLAVAAVFASGTAVAGEVYSSDAATVSLSGEVKASGSHIRASGKKADGTALDADKNLAVGTSAKLSVSATHQLNDAVELGASFDIKDDSDVFQDVKVFGSGDFGKLTLGATGNSFGAVEKAGAGEGSNIYAVSQGSPGENGVRYEKSFDDVAFSANYATNSDVKNSDSAYAASLAYSADTFSAAVAYGTDGDSATSVGVAGDVTFGDVKVGATYIDFENAGKVAVNDIDTETSLGALGDNEGKSYGVGLTYTLGDASLFASAQK